MKKRTVFILVGAPGAGKTTWARNQKEYLINIDLKRKALLGDWAINPSDSLRNEAFNLAIMEAKVHLGNGESIIWDATNLRRERRKIISALCNYADDFIAVVFTAPLEDCLQRNRLRPGIVEESIIKARFNSLSAQPVELSEGIENIVYI